MSIDTISYIVSAYERIIWLFILEQKDLLSVMKETKTINKSLKWQRDLHATVCKWPGGENYCSLTLYYLYFVKQDIEKKLIH